MKIALLSILMAGLMLLTSCTGSEDAGGWTTLINHHLRQYPEMQAVDIYKLIYQGVLGPGHLGTDAEVIRKYLDEEIAGIEADPDMQLIENIAPDSQFIRINLKKFKNLELPVDDLVSVIIHSSQYHVSNRETFIKVWNSLKKQVETGRIKTDKENYLEFCRHIEAGKYPVVHHSEAYNRHYSPAYRVVLKSAWEEMQSRIQNDN